MSQSFRVFGIFACGKSFSTAGLQCISNPHLKSHPQLCILLSRQHPATAQKKIASIKANVAQKTHNIVRGQRNVSTAHGPRKAKRKRDGAEEDRRNEDKNSRKPLTAGVWVTVVGLPCAAWCPRSGT